MAELQRRGYVVWFDLEKMKGSVMDAMSEAVEGAELMLYGVSERYKERRAHRSGTALSARARGRRADVWAGSQRELSARAQLRHAGRLRDDPAHDAGGLPAQGLARPHPRRRIVV